MHKATEPLVDDRFACGWRAAVWWTTFVLCGSIYLFHFSLVQLGNMPLSPLKLDLAEIVAGYVNPFFAQRWNFFAPQPIERDTTVLARARYHDDASGEQVETDWIDVTDPLIDAVRQNRLTPLFLVGIGLSNAANDFENGLAKNDEATFTKDGKTYIKHQLPASIDPFNVAVVTRTALATLELALPGRKLDQVQIGFAHYSYPRFTERHRQVGKDRPASLITIEWQPASHVVPYCCSE